LFFPKKKPAKPRGYVQSGFVFLPETGKHLRGLPLAGVDATSCLPDRVAFPKTLLDATRRRPLLLSSPFPSLSLVLFLAHARAPANLALRPPLVAAVSGLPARRRGPHQLRLLTLSLLVKGIGANRPESPPPVTVLPADDPSSAARFAAAAPFPAAPLPSDLPR
jgi:hypothetical protein